jgi:citrate synthase
MTTIESLPAGLRGVVVSDTAIGDVRGAEGYYHYRGRSAVELARTSTFDDAAALVLDGELPDEAGRARFRAELAERRELPDAVHAVLPTLAAAGHEFAPLAGLRAALATLGAADDLAPVWGATPRARRADALRVVAATPTILAALHRLRRGLEPVVPRDDLHGAAAWLHLLHGTEPDPQAAAAVEHYLVATIDHGFNASTFTARVAASAGTDVASAVVAALGTFAGPLHGGAPDRALEAVDEIGSPDRVDDYVRAKLEAGDRIMGFGHAVYRTADPRAVLLRDVARGLRDRPGGEVVALAETVQERTEALLAEYRPGRDLRANVEFWAGVVMHLAGIPREMFTPTFAVSRVVGWAAHVLEQAGTSTIIRPSARYVGPVPAV